MQTTETTTQTAHQHASADVAPELFDCSEPTTEPAETGVDATS